VNIFDLVNAAQIATYWNETASERIPYLGATLFPAQKQLGLDLSWIKGSKGLPVALTPSAFDAKATVRDRIGVSKVETEMPFFRESMIIKEKDRQELNKLMAADNARMLEPVIRKIYDDAGNLIDGADVQAERMRMQLLSTGAINITDNRMIYTYDYQMPATHKKQLDTTARWSVPASATPISDIQGWQDIIEEDTGVRPTRAICTRKTWAYLLTNASIKSDMNVTKGDKIILTDSMLQQYLMAKLGLQVAVYNKKYATVVAGSGAYFYPDELFTLIPEGNLGNTYYGTTPEESDLMSGNTDAQVQIVNTGVAVTSIKIPHPVNIETIVSAIVLPSFERIDEILIATVHH